MSNTDTPTVDEIIQLIVQYQKNHSRVKKMPALTPVEAKTAINQYLLSEALELIGEDELAEQYSKANPTNKYLVAENRLRAQLRQAAYNKYGGK